METKDVLIAQAMAYEAVLIALIRTHPERQAFSDALEKSAAEASERLNQIQIVDGTRIVFDAKVAILRSS